MSTHVWSFSSLSSGPWNCAIYARHTACYSSCELDRHIIIMLSSSCEFWHAHHHHAIIILWVRNAIHLVSWTDTSSSCYHHIVSAECYSSCEFWHAHHHHAIIILWVQHAIHLVSSACYHHLVNWTDTSSSCYHHIVSAECYSSCEFGMLSSSCEFMLPKRRFWKPEQTFQSAVSKHFSTFFSPNPVLTPLKSASKTCSEMFVRPSKIFVWDG